LADGDDDDYGGPERRRTSLGRRSEDVVGWRLGTLENDLQHVELRLDKVVMREELEQRFSARDAHLAREYVPRRELQEKRDWNLRIWLGLISLGQLIIAAAVIRGH
jgi:hypothetical protein